MPDNPPDYTPYGFTDIWKGEYHGEPVCVKVARGRFLGELRKVEEVQNPSIQSEVYSVRFIPDIPSRGRREQAQFSSECASCHPGFGGTVSGLYHESVGAKWEHRSVHQSEPGRRSSDARTSLLVEIDGNNLLTVPAIACTSVPRPHTPS